MLKIENNGTIRLTRGDNADFRVALVIDYGDCDFEKYTVKSGDTLTLSIKKTTKDPTPLVQKIVVGNDVIAIEPVDTKNLEFGKYKYDVELKTSNGKIYTVIGPAIFEVMEEVT